LDNRIVVVNGYPLGLPGLARFIPFGSEPCRRSFTAGIRSAHSLRSLERNILKFAGIKPARERIFRPVEAASGAKRAGWLGKMTELDRRAR
jgi:hypothetical protein